MEIINVLIPFNLILDTDYGLYNLIKRDYLYDEHFYYAMFKLRYYDVEFRLLNRDDPNPLTILLKDKSLAEPLYKDFIDKKYEEICSLAHETMLNNVTTALKKSMNQMIRTTLLCENQIELNEAKKRKLNVDHMVVDTIEHINLDKYGTLYVKNVYDLDRYKNVVRKNIYVPDYMFNITIFEEDPMPLLPEDILLKYSGKNEFNIFTLYRINMDSVIVED